MSDADRAMGRFMVLCGDSRLAMKSIPTGVVDSIITDPPYRGFEFNNENYFGVLDPFLAQITRCLGDGGRLAISQPEHRLKQLTQKLGAGSVIRVIDAFADRRGDDAFFFAQNAAANKRPRIAQWTGLPESNHPNPRDVNKMSELVELMSAPGDLILDPFCGSGAIGLAAVLLGRNYVGIELERGRAEDARRRFLEIGAAELADIDWRRGRDSNPR